MQNTTKQSVEVTLVLDEKEADWLHGVMQNPLHGQSPDDESPEDAEMRIKFFLATKQ
jgi:hypothetical protein